MQNILQVGKSDGIDPVSLDHDFYGISSQGNVFSMASFRVVESGPNTNKGTLELHVYNSEGVSVPVLSIGENGTTVAGSFNVKGEHTSFKTTSVVVEDKDVVLASGATTLHDLDGGGIILGTQDSGTKSLLYDTGPDSWKSSIGIDVDGSAAFTVGGNQAVLSGDGLSIGDLHLSPGSLQLSSNISLETKGLDIGDISITPLGGLVIGGQDPIVVDTSGVKIGESVSLGVDTGLSILSGDILLDSNGLQLKKPDSAIYIGDKGWKIGYDALSRHLIFQCYDSSVDSYVTKAEIKS